MRLRRLLIVALGGALGVQVVSGMLCVPPSRAAMQLVGSNASETRARVQPGPEVGDVDPRHGEITNKVHYDDVRCLIYEDHTVDCHCAPRPVYGGCTAAAIASARRQEERWAAQKKAEEAQSRWWVLPMSVSLGAAKAAGRCKKSAGGPEGEIRGMAWLGWGCNVQNDVSSGLVTLTCANRFGASRTQVFTQDEEQCRAVQARFQ